jgi:sucrose-6-phosphate hydrolase SacC (GH32 family)
MFKEIPHRTLALAGVGIVIATALLLNANSNAQQAGIAAANPWQPRIHFTSPPNWINDPNGPIFLNGQYHLFFQTNPSGDQWGHMSWGHATSPDLIHWKQLPVALSDENGIAIFSGSTVEDGENTSGLCGDPSQKTPGCLVAVYTGASQDKQTQNLAFSRDGGTKWTKYSANPVIDLGLKAFRDPKVFWHAASKSWVMVVALPDQHKLRIYRSANLRQWELASEFGPAGAVGGAWECPDLFELPIYDDSGKLDGSRWLLSVNVNPGGPAGGSGDQYFVGQFDGSRFTEDHPGSGPHWVDFGNDFYASTSFANNSSIEDRIWIAWMSNWKYAAKLPTLPGRGEMALARRLYFREPPAYPPPTPAQEPLMLTQKPVLGLPADKRYRAMFGAPAFQTIDKANQRIADKKLSGSVYRLRFTLDPGDASEAGVRLRRSATDPSDQAQEETVVGLDMSNGRIFVDRSRSGKTDWSPDFAKRVSAPVKHLQAEGIPIEIVVDKNSIEVFADDGETVLTDLIYPAATSQGLAFYATATPPGTAPARVRDLEMISLPQPEGK